MRRHADRGRRRRWVVVLGRFGRMRVAVQNRRRRVNTGSAPVFVIDKHVHGRRDGRELRQRAESDASNRDVANERPHGPADYARDGHDRQSCLDATT